jgi:hypothetical protein
MTAPSLNWENFDPGHIDKKLSEKDGNDGYKIIIWQSAKGAFSKDTIDSYATGKHWVLANEGDRDEASISWFDSAYQEAMKAGQPDRESTPPFSFNKGTVYTYTFITSTWVLGKSKVWKVYLWVSEDEDRMCVLPAPQFGYFTHVRRRY